MLWMYNAHCAWTRGCIFGVNNVGFNFYKTHWYSLFIFCPKKYGKTVALASEKALTWPPPLFTFPGVEDIVNTTKKERETTTSQKKHKTPALPHTYIGKGAFRSTAFPTQKGQQQHFFFSLFPPPFLRISDPTLNSQ